eukprot:CAMPEP_0169300138 /NCGR_PEP_ID=MMETSP1016-20121227/67454_1 /TAXON_ID=342587 /ORGANISM="Karlodinium micrum, Strain CCMP2283" /LENGTH=91 /DNA_ID=CAMNT_0009392457 /DNA_START=427 /DNA_END=705 /DNA_ORIENTATION=+
MATTASQRTESARANDAAPAAPAHRTATSDVACASCWLNLKSLDVMQGIDIKPPPIPTSDPAHPAAAPVSIAFAGIWSACFEDTDELQFRK